MTVLLWISANLRDRLSPRSPASPSLYCVLNGFQPDIFSKTGF
jgi:hypothetical protein